MKETIADRVDNQINEFISNIPPEDVIQEQEEQYKEQFQKPRWGTQSYIKGFKDGIQFIMEILMNFHMIISPPHQYHLESDDSPDTNHADQHTFISNGNLKTMTVHEVCSTSVLYYKQQQGD